MCGAILLRLKILVLTDRFLPEIAAPSFRTMEHAKIWRDLGHDVTVVTCVPNFPRGKVFEGYRNRLWQEETMDGVRVIRIWSYMVPNEGVLKRTLDYVSFMVSAVLFSPKYPAFDVVLATSPPFFVAIAGAGVSILRNRPWIFEIRDLWPASIRAVGASRSPALALVERLELLLYRHATRIVSLTHSFKRDLVERGIPAEKNDVVTNGVDGELFSRERATLDARAELGIGRDVFLTGYIGTVGLAHGLGTILDAAERTRDERGLAWLILGEGAERAHLEADAARRGLSNVLFRDFVGRERMPSYLAAMDASIVHLKPEPLFKTVIPSKIFEAMAMGVPLVMAVEGESADIVRDAGAGVCVPSGDAEALARAVVELKRDPARARALGESGRTAVRARYDRRRLGEAVLRSLETAVADWRGARV